MKNDCDSDKYLNNFSISWEFKGLKLKMKSVYQIAKSNTTESLATCERIKATRVTYVTAVWQA